MASLDTVVNPNDISDDILDGIFDLLKRKGPLCASQISVELFLPVRKVMGGLVELQREGLVELRPDRDETKNRDEELMPWGLSRSLKRKKAS
jgi:Mn-dependent DtxR family transcriptional regulator